MNVKTMNILNMILSIPTQDLLLPPLLCQNVSPCHLLSGATCPPCFQLPTKQRTRSFLLCQSKLLSPRDAACQATVTLGDRLGPKNGRFSFLSATGRTTGHQDILQEGKSLATFERGSSFLITQRIQDPRL